MLRRYLSGANRNRLLDAALRGRLCCLLLGGGEARLNVCYGGALPPKIVNSLKGSFRSVAALPFPYRRPIL
jgi:hypothetical protein